MSTLREAARALIERWDKGTNAGDLSPKIQALRAAFAEPAPEPVAWMYTTDRKIYGEKQMPALTLERWRKSAPDWCELPLYAVPPAQPAPSAPGWIKCSETMPKSGITVLAYHKNEIGKDRRIRAAWIAKHTVEAFGDGVEWSEYDEATDTNWWPEGWYEQIEHWNDLTACAVVGVEITHWMLLPPPPIAAAPQGDKA